MFAAANYISVPFDRIRIDEFKGMQVFRTEEKRFSDEQREDRDR